MKIFEYLFFGFGFVLMMFMTFTVVPYEPELKYEAIMADGKVRVLTGCYEKNGYKFCRFADSDRRVIDYWSVEE